MIVGTLNVKYSPNLGDGLLAECLEAELRSSGVETRSIDLAGRTAYGEGLKHRRAILTVLEHAPGIVRQLGVGAALGLTVQRRLRPRWREAFGGLDAIVLGGGNLLADADLNFPTKIDGALAEAAIADIPLGVYGVGVSDNWSRRGQVLFERAFADSRLTHVAVRDERSKAIWDRRLGSAGVPLAEVCPDPAVLAGRHFPAVARAPGPPRIGLGLTDPLALRYHTADRSVREEALADWMVEVVKAMAAKGWQVCLFTNGSPEDRAYLQKVAPQLQAAGGDVVSVTPAFSTPADLAGFISGLDLVMAHRMHACIAAYAYAKPHIGFAWDEKLRSFFNAVGRDEFVADAGRVPVSDLLALADRALAEGIAPGPHAACVGLARTEIARLVASFEPTRATDVPMVAAQ
ncbi:MAG: polysaccharide pyruvyl transferase family protein [Caulobacteraceae bacterium]|nr:MAG: polysaccharide pyruvyl transferase family protein [Caulobacteraceae bacterium]